MGKKNAFEEETKQKQEWLESQLAQQMKRQEVLASKVEKELPEVRELLKESIKTEGSRLESIFKGAREETSKTFSAQVQDLLGQLEAVKQSVQQADGRLVATEAALADVDRRHADMERRASSDSQAAASGLEELRSELGASEERGASRAQALLAESEERSKAALQELDARVSATLASVLEQSKALQASREELSESIGRAMDAERVAGSELRRRLEEGHRELQGDLQKRADEVLAGLEDSAAKGFASLQDVLQDAKAEVDRVALSAKGCFNRSAVWRLHGFKNKLHHLLQTDGEMLRSPGLTLCGLPEVTLELHVPSVGDKVEGGSTLPMPGWASLRLWAPRGLRLSFRVLLGEGPGAISHTFEHTFEGEGDGGGAGGGAGALPGPESADGGEAGAAGEAHAGQGAGEGLRGGPGKGGQGCLQMWNVCQPGLLWDRRADTFCIGLEVLDFTFDVHSVEPIPGTQLTKLSETLRQGPDDTTRYIGDDDETMPGSSPDVTDLAYTRAWSCEANLRQSVTQDVLGVKSRSIRRVEWRLESCSRLLDVCRAGESVDSPVFQAAGLDRIQLHFFPLGCDRAEGDIAGGSQPCALLVSGPSRTSLRGMLHVGSNARTFEHRFDRRGDMGGRSRFCVLQNSLSADDAVTLALEIVEVEVDLPDVSTSLCLRSAKLPSGPGSGQLSAPLHLAGTKGLLQVRREDPSRTEEFVKCVSLPTLNSRHMVLPSLKAGRRS